MTGQRPTWTGSGRQESWYRHAQQRPEGRIRASGAERDVTFEHPETVPDEDIDRACRTKYGRYGEAYAGPTTGPDAKAATVRLMAR